MRSFLKDHWKAIVAIILLVVLALFTVNPGGATPAPSLAARLRAHVAAVAPGGVCDSCSPGLQQQLQAARYITATLRDEGYAVRRPPSQAGGQAPRNIEVSVANLAPHARPERIFIVGAHVGAPADGISLDAGRADTGNLGAGTGTAAVLELARLLKALRPSLGTEIRFVFFFDAADHGPEPSSGRDFIAFVGTLDASRPVQRALAAFRGSPVAAIHGLAAPAYVQGVTLSGHTAYRGAGAPTVMVTDTAFGRYPYFEAINEPADNAPDKADYSGIARVVSGLARTLAALAAAQRS